MAIIDLSMAITLIIILIVGAFVVNLIFQRRRREMTRPVGQDSYDADNNLITDGGRSDRSSIISGLPTAPNKLKIIAAYSDIHCHNNSNG